MDKSILTKRETEVFKLLVNNKTTKEIAEYLGISEKTVRNHISNTMQSSCHRITAHENNYIIATIGGFFS